MNEKMRSLVVFTLLACGSIHFVHASPDDAAKERRKGHIVSRIHQLVYGGPELCDRVRSPDLQAALAASERFKQAYPELITLMGQSPHAEAAKERTRKMVEGSAALVAKESASDAECKGSIAMLLNLIDEPSGKVQVAKTIDELKK